MFANKSMNGAIGMSDIEGKATRAGASERGKRTSFKAIQGYYLIKPEDLHWRPSNLMKIPNADYLERTGSENIGARLWRLPPKSANTLHRHIRSEEFYFVLEGTGRMVCIEHHERVVIRHGVIRRVQRRDLDIIALGGGAGVEGFEIRLEHRTKGCVSGRDEVGDGLGRCGTKVCGAQAEAFLKRRGRRAKRYGVRDCALSGRLYDYTRRDPWNRNVHPITSRPRRCRNSFVVLEQRSP